LQLQIKLEVEEVLRGCFAATYVTIKAPDEQPQRFLKDVQENHSARKNDEKDGRSLTIFSTELARRKPRRTGLKLRSAFFTKLERLDSHCRHVGIGDWIDLFGCR